MSGPDPAEFKAAQREAWGDAAAGWRKWERVFEAGAQALNERLVDLAGVRAGHRVLDVATGIGEPALTAARRVGPKGSVLATDLAPPMLAVARERASQHGLANLETREADAEALDLEPASFDAATCRWGLMLMQDPRAAARGILRALRPGARLAAAVWGAPERVPFLAIPHTVAQRELGVPDAPAGPGAFALSADGALEAVARDAGFRDVRVERFRVVMEYESPNEYARFLGDLSATLRKALAAQPETVRDRAFAAIEREAGRFRANGGAVRLENEVLCLSATR